MYVLFWLAVIVLIFVALFVSRFWGLWLLTGVLHFGLNLSSVALWLHVIAWLVWVAALIVGLIANAFRHRLNRARWLTAAQWLNYLAFVMVLAFIVYQYVILPLVGGVPSWHLPVAVVWLLFGLLVLVVVLLIFLLVKALWVFAVIAVLVAALLGWMVFGSTNGPDVLLGALNGPQQSGVAHPDNESIHTGTPSGNSSTGTGNTGNGNGNTPKANAATRKAMTVTTVNVDCLRVVERTNGAVISSHGHQFVKLQAVAKRHRWSDAYWSPFNGRPTRAQVEATACSSPLYGVGVLNRLTHLKIGGVSWLAQNPWARPFAGNPSRINDVAASYMPLLNKSSAWVNAHPAAVKRANARYWQWEFTAEKLGTFLDRWHVAGVKSLSSDNTLHVSGLGAGLPEVSVDPRTDTRPALVMEWTQKNACASLARIGFNVGDRRPEVFSTPTCAAPPRVSHRVRHHGTTTGHGGCTNCGPTGHYGCQHYGTCGHSQPGCTTKCHGGPPPHHKCPCTSKAKASEPVPTPATQPKTVPTHAPKPNPTQSVDPSNPSQGQTGGDNGGSTSNPVPSGTPTPGDTATHSTPEPTPTGGPFG